MSRNKEFELYGEGSETLDLKVTRVTYGCEHLGASEDEPNHWQCPDCGLGRYGGFPRKPADEPPAPDQPGTNNPG